MNSLVVLLANGDALFLGMALVTGALILLKHLQGSPLLMRALPRVAMLIGVGLIIASSTPLNPWVYGGWIALWLVSWFAAVHRRSSRYWSATSAVFLLFSGVLCLMELQTRKSPIISLSKNQEIYVIGDSISAGMGTAERNWPEVLSKRGQLQVTNLARPGATAASAVQQVSGTIKPNSVVILEIGGNDLLGGLSSDQFHRDLEALIQRIPQGHQVVMFELPLLPFNQGYGNVQRSLAKKYNILLIPKKHLAAVIGANGNTLDGLHLSQKGHDALAETMLSFIAVDLP